MHIDSATNMLFLFILDTLLHNCHLIIVSCYFCFALLKLASLSHFSCPEALLVLSE